MHTYMSTKDIAAKVRAELKKELPAWKFSVRMQSFSGGSSITLALLSGPEQVLTTGRDYEQVNHYYIDTEEVLNDKGKEVMKKAVSILSTDHWDESEPMIDYFSCNFYRHVEVGKWDRPYQVKS